MLAVSDYIIGIGGWVGWECEQKRWRQGRYVRDVLKRWQSSFSEEKKYQLARRGVKQFLYTLKSTYIDQLLNINIIMIPHQLLESAHHILFLANSEIDLLCNTTQDQQMAHLAKMVAQQTTQMKTKFKQSIGRLHKKILKFDIFLDKQVIKIQELWQELGWPFFHRFYYSHFLQSTLQSKLPSLIQTQLFLIKSHKHILFKCLNMIKSREGCLKYLKAQLVASHNQQILTEQDVQDHIQIIKQFKKKTLDLANEINKQFGGYKFGQQVRTNSNTKLGTIFVGLEHLRKLNCYTVQLINNWKKYIYSLSNDHRKKAQRLIFAYKQANYFLQILNDTNFLRKSFLSNYINFGIRNDPFVLKPLLHYLQFVDQYQQDQKCIMDLLMPGQTQKMLQSLKILGYQFIRYCNKYQQLINKRKRLISIAQLKRETRLPSKRLHTNQSVQKQKSNNLIRAKQIRITKKKFNLSKSLQNNKKLAFISDQLDRLQQQFLSKEQKYNQKSQILPVIHKKSSVFLNRFNKSPVLQISEQNGREWKVQRILQQQRKLNEKYQRFNKVLEQGNQRLQLGDNFQVEQQNSLRQQNLQMQQIKKVLKQKLLKQISLEVKEQITDIKKQIEQETIIPSTISFKSITLLPSQLDQFIFDYMKKSQNLYVNLQSKELTLITSLKTSFSSLIYTIYQKNKYAGIVIITYLIGSKRNCKILWFACQSQIYKISLGLILQMLWKDKVQQVQIRFNWKGHSRDIQFRNYIEPKVQRIGQVHKQKYGSEEELIYIIKSPYPVHNNPTDVFHKFQLKRTHSSKDELSGICIYSFYVAEWLGRKEQKQVLEMYTDRNVSKMMRWVGNKERQDCQHLKIGYNVKYAQLNQKHYIKLSINCTLPYQLSDQSIVLPTTLQSYSLYILSAQHYQQLPNKNLQNYVSLYLSKFKLIPKNPIRELWLEQGVSEFEGEIKGFRCSGRGGIKFERGLSGGVVNEQKCGQGDVVIDRPYIMCWVWQQLLECGVVYGVLIE